MSDDEEIVLTLDIGSSSIRCGAYKVIGDSKVERLEGCFASRVLRTVEPNTGKIELRTEHGKSLLDEIDAIVDETLENLRKYPTSARVVGMGFASFCMNLIAVDASGIPVGKEATLSYACSTPTVADVCKRLKRYVRSRPVLVFRFVNGTRPFFLTAHPCLDITANSERSVKMNSTNEQGVPCIHHTPCHSFVSFTQIVKRRTLSLGSSFGRLSPAHAYPAGWALRFRISPFRKQVGLDCSILGLWSGTKKRSRCSQMNARVTCHHSATIGTMLCHPVEYALRVENSVLPETPIGIAGLK